jgi:hypothetical protein
MNPAPNGSRWSVVLLLMGLAGLAHFNRIAISVAASSGAGSPHRRAVLPRVCPESLIVVATPGGRRRAS